MAEFKINRIRYTWKGEWSSGNTYYIDDIVAYGSKVYVCLQGHTAESGGGFYNDLTSVESNTNPLIPAPRWEQMLDGFTWTGNWQSSILYNLNDLVKYGGIVYRCITNHISTTALELDQANWSIYAKTEDWKSDWTILTTYKVNDIVKYGGIVYRCITAHTSAATEVIGLEIDQSKWEIVHSGIEYRATWSGSSVRYKLNDLVKYGARIYICILGHVSSVTFDESKWTLFVVGQEFESNAWSALTNYQPGDVVRYGGYNYLAKTFTIGDVPSIATSDWEIQSKTYNFRNDWSNVTSYKTGDVVRRNGQIFACIQDSTGNDTDNTAFWELLISGVFYTGEWEESLTSKYVVGDLVTTPGYTFRCIENHLPTLFNKPVVIETAATSNTWMVEYVEDPIETQEVYPGGTIHDSQGNIYVLIGTNPDYPNPSPAPKYTINVLVKKDPDGNTVWQKRYNKSDKELFSNGITIDSNNDIIITFASDTLVNSIFVLKLNTEGAIIWETEIISANSRFYSPSNQEYYTSADICVDSNDNIIIVATLGRVGTTFFNGGYSLATFKLNSSGVIQWQRRLGNDYYNRAATGVCVDTDNDVYICGYGDPTYDDDQIGIPTPETPGQNAVWIVAKYNAAGTLQWQKYLGDPIVDSYNTNAGTDRALTIISDSNNNVYVGGMRDFALSASYATIVKFNSSGVVQWKKHFTSGSNTYQESIHALTIDPNNYIYALGSTADSLLLFKITLEGNLLWQRKIDVNNYINSWYYYGQRNISVLDNSLAIAGFYYTTGNYSDVLIAKLSTEGDDNLGTYGLFVYTETNYTFDTSDIPEQVSLISELAGDSEQTFETFSTRGFSYGEPPTNLTVTTTGLTAPSILGTRGTNGDVYAIALQSDGKILIGGSFTSYALSGDSTSRLARLNADGPRDVGWYAVPGFNDDVYAIAVQSDGKILAGGRFTSYFGVTQNRITRINTDGSRDTSFDIGTGFNNGFVTAIVLQTDGKILVGGAGPFTAYNGAGGPYLFRLNSDGSRDTGFVIGTGFNSNIQSIAVQSDGKILVGGNFFDYDGTTVNRIIRLNSDGSRDTGFTIGTGFDNTVRAITIQSDGKILVGGNFTSYNGTTQNGITRLNSDGSRDTGFTIGTGFNDYVWSIAVQSDGKILAGGNFTSYNGTAQNYITRLNTDGSRDTSFATGPGFNNEVFSIVLQPNGKILVGGLFTSYEGETVFYITRINSDGSLDIDFEARAAYSFPANTYQMPTPSITISDITTLDEELIEIGSAGSGTYIFQYGDLNVNAQEDFGSGVAYDSLGNLYIVGRDNGTSIAFLLKLSPTGSLIWQKSFNTGDLYPDAAAIAIDSSDNIYIAINGADSGVGFYIIKINQSAGIVWQQKFSEVIYSINVSSIAVDSSNNLHIIGQRFDGLRLYAVVLKLDSAGDILWKKYIAYSGYPGAGTRGQSITFNSSGEIYIVGHKQDNTIGFLLKYDTNGNVLWQRSLEAVGVYGSLVCPFGVALDSIGNIYISSRTSANFSNVELDCSVVKYDSSGTLIWQRTFSDIEHLEGNSIAIDSLDNLYISGYSNSSGGTTPNATTATYDIFILKINSSGNLLWTRALGNRYTDDYVWYSYGTRSITVKNNNLAIVGYTYSESGYANLLAAQLPTDGSFPIFSISTSTDFTSNLTSVSVSQPATSNLAIQSQAYWTIYTKGNSNNKLSTQGDLIVYRDPSLILSKIIEDPSDTPQGGFGHSFYAQAIATFGDYVIIGSSVDSKIDNAVEFNIGRGLDSVPEKIIVQPDGKILLTGYFIAFNGIKANHIIRLNSDGTRDTSFITGRGFTRGLDQPYEMALQPDGKIIVGGYITSYDGATRNYITRINSDGSLDTLFDIGLGFNGVVRAVYVQSDNKILVGGQFTEYDGVIQTRITRLNSDGSRDTSFTIGTGFNNAVEEIAVQSDGKILVSGSFNAYNGVATPFGFARLNSDGSRDTSFATGPGFNGTIKAITIQSDGKILVGGYFTSYNGTAQNYIIRLNTDGSRDTSFAIGTGFDDIVEEIAIQSDGKILVVGWFTEYNDTTQNRIVRLNSNGSIDTSFVTGTGFDERISSIALQSDGKIITGGYYTLYNGVYQNYIARLDSSGAADYIGQPNSGRAHVFKISTGELVRTFNNPDSLSNSANDRFGRSVDIWGNYAVVSSFNDVDSVGLVYVFDVSNGELIHTLSNPNTLEIITPNTEPDTFGNDVAISEEYIVVGAPGVDDTSISSVQASTSTNYIPGITISPLPNTSTRITTTLSSGTSTFITNNLLGAALLTASTVPDIEGPYDPGDDSWWEITLPFSVDYAGSSYSTIWVNSNSYILFGSKPIDNYDSSISWNYSELTPPIPKIQINTADRSAQRIYYGAEGTAPNRTFRIRFEGHVDYFDGVLGSPTVEWEVVFYENTPNQIDIHLGIFPGTTADSSGAVYIFDLENGNLLHTISNPNISVGNPTFDYFGNSIDIENNYIIVGASGTELLTDDAVGRAYIFEADTAQLLYNLPNPTPQPIDTGGGNRGGNFGARVAISSQYAVIGAPTEERVSPNERNSGRAHVYDVNTGNLLYTLLNPNFPGQTGITIANFDQFGTSVAVNDSYVIVYAPEAGVIGIPAYGKVYVYEASTGNLLYALSEDIEKFGAWQALSENYILVTAGSDRGSDPTPRVFVYEAFLTSGKKRLPIGFEDQILKTTNTLTKWETFSEVPNIYYVSTEGVDALGKGTTIDRPWRTIKYACENVTGPATIFIKTGYYEEELPISIPANVALVGDELRSVTVAPVAGDETKDMFYVRNGSGIRNMTLTGLTGTLGALNIYLTQRPTAGAYVSLDPGTGPSDTSVHITTRSPYIQNVTTFGTGCVGLKVDGSLHNAGNRSIVANDFTQILSDGIGAWVTNRGLSELVSVFSYYGHIGYLAENGGKIRATNGNSSYGKYGCVAEGFDNTETPITGTVNNRSTQAAVASAFSGQVGDQILILEYEHCGQNYSSATYSFVGAGTGASATPNVRNGAVSEVRLITPGDSSVAGGGSYLNVVNNAQTGNTTSITLASNDPNLAANYIGMRVVIVSGTGTGQYGYIQSYNDGSKIATIYKESDSTPGWDHLAGLAIETLLDNTTQYSIEPRVIFSAPGTGITAKGRAITRSGRITSIRIWDCGSGYTVAPTITLTDPNNTSEALFQVRIANGALGPVTWVSRGTGYQTTSTRVTIAGNGFADKFQTGDTLALQGLPRIPGPGDNLNISGINDVIYKVVTVESVNGTVGNYNVTITLSPTLGIEESPAHNTAIIIRERYSQVRLTGHDFLDIGTGNFNDTDYPDLYTDFNFVPAPENEVYEQGGGRVFYTSTDQDGNFRVGELFRVDQATGTVTISASVFNLGGLEEISLGGVTVGGSGTVIREFSTDSTFTADSNNIIPTQRAIKSYLEARISGGGSDAFTTILTAGTVRVGPSIIGTTTNLRLNMGEKVNFTGDVDGAMASMLFFFDSFKDF